MEKELETAFTQAEGAAHANMSAEPCQCATTLVEGAAHANISAGPCQYATTLVESAAHANISAGLCQYATTLVESAAHANISGITNDVNAADQPPSRHPDENQDLSILIDSRCAATDTGRTQRDEMLKHLKDTSSHKIFQILNQVQNDGNFGSFCKVQHDVMVAAGRPKSAFTLAEVLIALGIIGIVAAMTIPTLVQNYKRKQASVKIKHFYSMMTQAIQLSEVENGSALYWTKESNKQNDNEDDTSYNETQKKYVLTFYNTYLRDYIKTANVIEQDKDNSSKVFFVYLNDGSAFSMHNGCCTDIRYYVNGYDENKTYVSGKDIFSFLLCNSEYNSSYHALTPNKAFGSYGSKSGFETREKALAKCKTSGIYCTVLLEIYDNFEFKDDYPYKL